MTEEKEGDGSLPLGVSNQDDVKVDNQHLSSYQERLNLIFICPLGAFSQEDVKVDNWHLSSYHEHLNVIFLPDRPACLIITLSLGFASDSLFIKPDQNNQK